MKGSIWWSYLAHFLTQARKNKKIHPQKNSLYFREWNFVALILKKILETETPMKFPILQETEALKKLLIFREMEPFSHPEKIYSISGNGNPEKISYIFSKESCSYIPLWFKKWNFLIFRERYIQNPSILRTRIRFRTLTYLEPEEYLEIWYTQNPVKHLRWNVLQK